MGGQEMTHVAGVEFDPRLWVRIARDLREKLSSGVIVAGDPVSITLLSEQWGASRQTVSRALRALEDDGLVRRYPGHGYCALSRE
jgi:DNA-binding GntR family transcriptional regulator